MQKVVMLVLSAALIALPAEAWGQNRGKQGKGKQAKKAAPSPPRKHFSDEAVAEAIRRGRDFLWRQQRKDGSWPTHQQGKDRDFVAGPGSLAAYALLASGVSAAEPRMLKSLEWLSKQPTDLTYTLGLRCNVWHLANKETRGRYLPNFKADLVKLLRFTQNGGYDYRCREDSSKRSDNSNAQYGVLGAWAGALSDLEIPTGYWKLVLNHWLEDQQKDGGWTYQRQGASTATMTAGGIATLYVCFDNLLAGRFVSCSANVDFKPLDRGLEWMDKHFRTAVGGQGLMGHGDLYYFLYGTERVGLASGHKYFGTLDWYKLGAERMLNAQRNDGSWDGKYTPLISTAFAMLFLVRGQHAIAFNKLEFDGDWNNRPRDLAMLTRWMSGTMERTLNWQIINLKVPTEEWHDAHVLYLSGADAPKLTAAHLDKLRQYLWQGGTIFSATECGGKGFHDGIREVYKKLLPQYEMKQLPPDHELFTVYHKLTGVQPTYMITNGVRPLVIHTDYDLPRSWQVNAYRSAERDFQIAANVLMYATDMGQLRNRGVSHWPAAPGGQPERTVKVVRVRHGGNWDPEPLALERFDRLLRRKEKVGLDVERPVGAAKLPESDARLALLTGAGPLTLNPAAAAGLKAYIEKGGTLFVDAAGGDGKFAEDAEAMLRELFGRREVRSLALTAGLFNLPGHQIKDVSYRRKARLLRGLKSEPHLRGVLLDGRLAVVFSEEDVTGGLVGIPCYTAAGYVPDSCYDILRNVVLLAGEEKGKRK